MTTTNELSPAAATPTPAPKKKKAAPRRVGTFTMGLCLILGGVLLCAFLIAPSAQLLRLLRFSPLVLVSLGAELLINHLVFKHKKLKYDFLSILVCALILLFGACGAAVGAVAELAVNAPVTVDSWRNDVRETCAGLLADEPVGSMQVHLPYSYDVEGYLLLHQMSMNELLTNTDLTISLTLSEEYDDAEDFTRAARRIIRTLHEGQVQPGSLILTGERPDGQLYRLDLDGLFAHKLSSAELEKLAEESIAE